MQSTSVVDCVVESRIDLNTIRQSRQEISPPWRHLPGLIFSYLMFVTCRVPHLQYYIVVTSYVWLERTRQRLQNARPTPSLTAQTNFPLSSSDSHRPSTYFAWMYPDMFLSSALKLRRGIEEVEGAGSRCGPKEEQGGVAIGGVWRTTSVRTHSSFGTTLSGFNRSQISFPRSFPQLYARAILSGDQ